MVTDFHFLWHIFSSTVKWLFIMNFVSSHQIFSVAMQQSHPSVTHWDDTILFPGFQTGMTASLTIVIPLLVSGMTRKEQQDDTIIK
ncbi:hypothetical protein [Wolbachia endosymbiont (group B) of Ennomos erosarius]|uniref:hypothetical protein n=1 Tax=Wolbachia endosymbiont (group B) of Ennomos erosarius TaxID=3066175 RepID=UPI0031332144